MPGVFERLDGSGEQQPKVASEMTAAVVADVVAAVEGGGKMLTDVDDFGFVAMMVVAVGAAVVSAGRG